MVVVRRQRGAAGRGAPVVPPERADELSAGLRRLTVQPDWVLCVASTVEDRGLDLVCSDVTTHSIRGLLCPLVISSQ